MSDHDEDPYAVSSDEDDVKGPPPKIAIERSTDLSQIKEALAPKEEQVKDENTLKEIEELRQQKANELKAMKADFEAGKIATAEGVQKQAEEITGLDKSTLSSFKDKFENLDATLEESLKERLQAIDKQLEGVGKENLSSMKERFESEPNKEFVGGSNMEELAELEKLRIEAASLRQRFEQVSGDSELSEEKRKQLEEEFAALKAERERAQKELEEERAAAAAEAVAKEEDVQVAADHASKMTAKWEKIHAKEAKKAEKSKMPQKVMQDK